MTDLSIRDGIGFCRIGNRTVILDINADRYWQMDGRAGEMMDQLRREGIVSDDEQRIASLVRRHFIEKPTSDRAIGKSRLNAFEPKLATASALEGGQASVRLRFGLLIEIGILLTDARLRVRFRSLRANLEGHLSGARRRPATSTQTLSDLARLFHAHRRWLVFPPACLPDTLAFLRFAARRHHRAAIVFGVEAFPFAAHCWAQSAELVLTDTIDGIRAFTPIYAL